MLFVNRSIVTKQVAYIQRGIEIEQKSTKHDEAEQSGSFERQTRFIVTHTMYYIHYDCTLQNKWLQLTQLLLDSFGVLAVYGPSIVSCN